MLIYGRYVESLCACDTNSRTHDEFRCLSLGSSQSHGSDKLQTTTTISNNKNEFIVERLLELQAIFDNILKKRLHGFFDESYSLRNSIELNESTI